MTKETDTLFNFPCDFPIKIMGRCDCDLEILVVEIINKYVRYKSRYDVNFNTYVVENQWIACLDKELFMAFFLTK